MDAKELLEALAAPFPADVVKCKPQAVKGDKALPVWYVDARAVEERLDAVFGVDGWQDEYQVLPDGSVVCRLSVRIGERWVVKCDVGTEGQIGDKIKGAFSDALKRAAVKFGIGRYLYRVKMAMLPYDSQYKRFKDRPRLPAEFLPKGTVPVRQQQARPAQNGPAPKAEKPAERTTINAAEWGHIKQLCEKHGCSQAKVLAYYNVAKPGQLPFQHYADCCRKIETKHVSFRADAPPPPRQEGELIDGGPPDDAAPEADEFVEIT